MALPPIPHPVGPSPGPPRAQAVYRWRPFQEEPGRLQCGKSAGEGLPGAVWPCLTARWMCHQEAGSDNTGGRQPCQRWVTASAQAPGLGCCGKGGPQDPWLSPSLPTAGRPLPSAGVCFLEMATVSRAELGDSGGQCCVTLIPKVIPSLATFGPDLGLAWQEVGAVQSIQDWQPGCTPVLSSCGDDPTLVPYRAVFSLGTRTCGRRQLRRLR